MKLYFSNTPISLFRRRPQRWIYLGSRPRVLSALRRKLPASGEVAFGELLYEKSAAVRHPFVQWLDAAGAGLSGKTEWLFSAPAVRNTYTSDLFLNVCYFEVVAQLLKEGRDVEAVFVESPALAECLRQAFPDQISVAPGCRFFSTAIKIKFLVRTILRFGRYLADYGARYLAARVVLRRRRQRLMPPDRRLVLIRNFISGSYADNEQDLLERHFFPGLYRYLETQGVWPVFLPIMIKPTNYLRLFREVRQARTRVVFGEEFLRFTDYVFAFTAPFRALHLALRPPLYGRFHLGALLREDFLRNVTSAEFLSATLLSRVGPRLKGDGWNPVWVVNWAENQAFEKGLLFGLKAAFPGLPIIGAQPFIVPPNYLAPVFSQTEKDAGLLPDRVLALGPLWQRAVKEFVRDLPTVYSPAFRYAAAAGAAPVTATGNDLLVLLGLDRENSVMIMRMLSEIKEALQAFDRIVIKLHPAAQFTGRTLASIIGTTFPEMFHFVAGRLDAYLAGAAVGLCGASGTAVELVMKGIPVVTIGETHTLTMNYLEYKPDPDIWRICFRPEQVVQALERFRGMRTQSPGRLQEKAASFRQDFIADTGRDYWQNCLLAVEQG